MLSFLASTSVPWLLLHLPTPADYPFIPRPAESHHVFGAGFIFIGAMMTAEGLGGRVWYRSFARTMVFPTILVMLGWGMLAVSMIEPAARLVHVSMGIPMIGGGWAEARCRLGLMERKYADVFIVPGLLLASIDTAFFHLNGAPTSMIVITHSGLIALSLVIAALRLYQSANPQSVYRSLFIAAAVFAIGLDLWVDAIFQR